MNSNLKTLLPLCKELASIWVESMPEVTNENWSKMYWKIKEFLIKETRRMVDEGESLEEIMKFLNKSPKIIFDSFNISWYSKEAMKLHDTVRYIIIPEVKETVII